MIRVTGLGTGVVATDADGAGLQGVPPSLSRGELIAFIRDEAARKGRPCTHEAAEALIVMLEYAASYCGTSCLPYRLNQVEISVVHPLLVVIMADGAVAAAGSAHEALNQALLGPGQIAFLHTRVAATGQQLGGLPMDCAVQVTVVAAVAA